MDFSLFGGKDPPWVFTMPPSKTPRKREVDVALMLYGRQRLMTEIRRRRSSEPCCSEPSCEEPRQEATADATRDEPACCEEPRQEESGQEVQPACCSSKEQSCSPEEPLKEEPRQQEQPACCCSPEEPLSNEEPSNVGTAETQPDCCSPHPLELQPAAHDPTETKHELPQNDPTETKEEARKSRKRKTKCGRPRELCRCDDEQQQQQQPQVTRRKTRCGRPKELCRCDDQQRKAAPEREWHWLIEVVVVIAALVAVVRSTTGAKTAREHYDSCVLLHKKTMFIPALNECKSAEAMLAANDPMLPSVRNSMALTLYDLGRLDEAVSTCPDVFSLNLAMITQARVVTDLLVSSLLPMGLKEGFIRATSSPAVQIVFRSNGSDVDLERAVAPHAIEACDRFRPCRSLLNKAVRDSLSNDDYENVPHQPVSAAQLAGDFTRILQLIRRHDRRADVGSPAAAVLAYVEATTKTFLSILQSYDTRTHELRDFRFEDTDL